MALSISIKIYLFNSIVFYSKLIGDVFIDFMTTSHFCHLEASSFFQIPKLHLLLILSTIENFLFCFSKHGASNQNAFQTQNIKKCLKKQDRGRIQSHFLNVTGNHQPSTHLPLVTDISGSNGRRQV